MITAKGNDVKQNMKKADLTVKDEYISLKTDEGVKVRVLGADDYVEYMAHGAYNLDIFTQPCPNPKAKDCVYCKASANGGEDFAVLRAKPRYLFAFGNMDNGRVMLLDVSKNQAKKLMASIDEYAEDLGEIAFTLKRVGAGKDTAYTLNPILKMKGNDADNFEKFEGVTVDVQFFIDRLEVRIPSEDFKVKMLAKNNYPVEAQKDIFGVELVEKALAEANEDATKIEDSEEAI